MEPVGLANARISTGYAQKSPRSLIHRLPTPTGLHVGHLPVFLYGFGVYYIDSSEMFGKFPEVLHFNRLFLKLNRL